jgi:4-hydroxy-2-oxoheptanedioate aldolase
MANNALLEKLLAGNTVLGFGNMYPASGIIEGAAKDFDFAWIDSQHGEHDYRTVLAACQACSGVNVAALVRVPGQEPASLGMYADLAPLGMMVPMVNTAEEAQRVVEALYFPPRGSRSFGGRRIIDLYGRDMPTEFHMIVVAQIETLKAVENVDAIINTDGIDMLFFGPDDMRICMGLPMNTPVLENDQLRDAAQRMGAAARQAGKFAGTVAFDPQHQKFFLEAGYQAIVIAGDIACLRTMAAKSLEDVKQVVAGITPTEREFKFPQSYYG